MKFKYHTHNNNEDNAKLIPSILSSGVCASNSKNHVFDITYDIETVNTTQFMMVVINFALPLLPQCKIPKKNK